MERFGQVALPPGAVRDGEVIDSEAVAAAIRELWARVKFSTKKVIVGVANQKVIVRQLDLPWMPIAELRKSLAFQVADVLPMPVEHAILDLHPLEEVEDENGRRQRILLVAASRDMVTSLISAVEAAGLTPTSVDLNSFAVLRVLADVDRLGLTRRAEALVDVGRQRDEHRRLRGRGSALRAHPAHGRRRRHREHRRPHGHSASSRPKPSSSTSSFRLRPTLPGASPVTRITESAADAWVEEVRGSLDYYFAQSGAARVSRIVLSGGGSQLGGLARRLAMTTGIPVEPATPLAPMQIGKTGLSEAQLDYVQAFSVVPVGLAMAGAA